MKKLTISVVMCVYNGAEFLLEQLDSIAGQTLLPDELIICDDQSTDTSKEIIESFTARAPFVVRFYVNSSKLGSTKNFEQGVDMCNGDIIVLCDQDDIWLSQKLSVLARTFTNSEETALLFSDALVVDHNLCPMGYTLWQHLKFTKRQQKQALNGDLYTVLLKHNVVTGATMAFRRCFRSSILPIHSQWVHDGWIALVISCLAKTKIVKEPLIMYRQHPDNQIGAKKMTFRQLITRSRKRIESQFFLKQFNQYEYIYEHLLRHGAIEKANLLRIQSKIFHLYVRSGVQDKRSTVLDMLKELSLLRYHHYSSGWKSFCEDLDARFSLYI